MISPTKLDCGISFFDSVREEEFWKSSRGVIIEAAEWLLSPIGSVYLIDTATMIEDAAFADLSVDTSMWYETMAKIAIMATIIPLLAALVVRAFDRLGVAYYNFTYVQTCMKYAHGARIPASNTATDVEDERRRVESLQDLRIEDYDAWKQSVLIIKHRALDALCVNYVELRDINMGDGRDRYMISKPTQEFWDASLQNPVYQRAIYQLARLMTEVGATTCGIGREVLFSQADGKACVNAQGFFRREEVNPDESGLSELSAAVGTIGQQRREILAGISECLHSSDRRVTDYASKWFNVIQKEIMRKVDVS